MSWSFRSANTAKSLVVQGLEGRGAGLGVQLEPDLGHAEPRLHALRHRERGVEVADVEREREAVARRSSCTVSIMRSSNACR